MRAAVTAKVSGGAKARRVLEAIGDKAGKGGLLRVGYLESSKYPDGMSVAQVAFRQEFGTPDARFPIPPRPTFRMMIAKHKAEWSKQLAVLLKTDGYDAAKSLRTMGVVIKDELVDSVLNANVAPISPVTAMVRKIRKGRATLRTVFEAIRLVRAGKTGVTGAGARRLVDSGVMERAPDFEIVP